MSLALYRGLTVAGEPMIRRYLERRQRAGKEDATRLDERFGIASRARPRGALIWIHAASVGEALSILSLAERLVAARDNLSLLVTTGTVTSATLLASRLPARAFHQFVPADCPTWVRRFLDHWRPDLALWVESELWPNLVAETHARRIPMALINARMSERSFARWRRLGALVETRRLLGSFALCVAQSQAEADRFAALGATRVMSSGNLKFASAPLPVDETELAGLRAMIGTRPTWVAASTHPGEEAILATAHRALRETLPDALLLLVPRHADRGDAVARELSETGLRLARRSNGEAIAVPTGVYLGDTMGELGLFYRLGNIAFVGGSLIRHGGQNPIEPAQLGNAILHGPHMWNFRDITAQLRDSGAAIELGDAATIAGEVSRLLSDAEERGRRGAAAMRVAAEGRGALDRVVAALDPLLRQLPAAEPDLASA